MAIHQTWNVEEITRQIHSMSRECKSPYNDGYNSWYIKQDLYIVKEALDEIFRTLPSFGEMEDEWLHKREQERIMKFLKD